MKIYEDNEAGKLNYLFGFCKQFSFPSINSFNNSYPNSPQCCVWIKNLSGKRKEIEKLIRESNDSEELNPLTIP